MLRKDEQILVMLDILVRFVQDLKELWGAQTNGRSNYKQSKR